VETKFRRKIEILSTRRKFAVPIAKSLLPAPRTFLTAAVDIHPGSVCTGGVQKSPRGDRWQVWVCRFNQYLSTCSRWSLSTLS